MTATAKSRSARDGSPSRQRQERTAEDSGRTRMSWLHGNTGMVGGKRNRFHRLLRGQRRDPVTAPGISITAPISKRMLKLRRAMSTVSR